MRRIVAIVLVLLLPLHGWVGSAMAVQMALPGSMPHQVAAAPAHGSEHHADAAAAKHQHGVLAAQAGDCGQHANDDATAAPDTQCHTCTLCQVCHNLAIPLPVSVLPGTEPLNPLPPLAARHFTSADPALGLKPPIS